jgi:IS5 family transposase
MSRWRSEARARGHLLPDGQSGPEGWSSEDKRFSEWLWGGSIFAITDAFRSVEYATGRPLLRPPRRVQFTTETQATTILTEGAGQKRGMTPALRRDLRRRSAIEPAIGHMKTDGRLARCALKGTPGDALHAVLCGCGHNIRMILAHLRALWAEILAAFYAMFATKGGLITAQTGLRPLAA